MGGGSHFLDDPVGLLGDELVEVGPLHIEPVHQPPCGLHGPARLELIRLLKQLGGRLVDGHLGEGRVLQLPPLLLRQRAPAGPDWRSQTRIRPIHGSGLAFGREVLVALQNHDLVDEAGSAIPPAHAHAYNRSLSLSLTHDNACLSSARRGSIHRAGRRRHTGTRSVSAASAALLLRSRREFWASPQPISRSATNPPTTPPAIAPALDPDDDSALEDAGAAPPGLGAVPLVGDDDGDPPLELGAGPAEPALVVPGDTDGDESVAPGGSIACDSPRQARRTGYDDLENTGGQAR